jgi:hypothetical protein
MVEQNQCSSTYRRSLNQLLARLLCEHKRNGGPPVIDDRRTNDEDRPAVSLSDCEAEWMERTRVVALEDALAQLHTDHVPMSGTILQFRRRTA